ncbi:cupredoxin family protein [Variovorax sp. J31P207]|uniref:cupredoxin domain-containing protein n=1 Tax=Variovorax sp. J31P207 TaxID=3053510 RepID=UPI0025764578|nr:cupredoxin family protein [Variovorax sp. J31P207]MDM0064978.1 cupredoxin family protein [Variovorax sp. J31P207]
MNAHYRHTMVAVLATTLSAMAAASGNHAGRHAHDAVDAFGKPGDATKADRRVKVEMTDGMRFNPSTLAVKQGETVRFVVSNSGQVKHELVLGTEKELKEHYEAMKKNPEMEHADPSMVTLAPGKTGEIVWQFTKAGKVDFACLQPGHYDAGMNGTVMVDKSANSAKQH